MSFLIAIFIKNLILFLQNTYGIISSPYKTYRRLARGEKLFQLMFLAGLIVFYFSWASAVRVGIRSPLLLAKNWVVSSAAAGVTFALTVGGIYVVARRVSSAPRRVQGSGEGGHAGGLVNLVLPWGYSLWPTLIWFAITSWSYLLFPPPRTASIPGKLFSFLFIVASLSLLFWKGVLYYLTLRFGLKLDLPRVLITSAIVFPAGILYSIAMYKLGIFRVPFI